MNADELYYVVVNQEEQYSIWEAASPAPAGWVTVGDPRAKHLCLDQIEKMWTDMRPVSVRRWMAEQAIQRCPKLAAVYDVEEAAERIEGNSHNHRQ